MRLRDYFLKNYGEKDYLNLELNAIKPNKMYIIPVHQNVL